MNRENLDPARIVPDKLKSPDTVPFLGIEFKNSLLLAAGTIVGLYGGSYLFQGYSSSIGFLTGAIGALGAYSLIYFSPNHLEAVEWLGTYSNYYRTPNVIRHLRTHKNTDRTQTEADESGLFTIGANAQEITRVKRIRKDMRVIERTDDTVISAVKVKPANMAFADKNDWDNAVDAFERYVDNVLEYDAQIYITSSPFDVDEHLRHYNQRMGDHDISTRPILRSLLDSYLSWYPDYLNYWGTFEREYYVLFPVEPNEVYSEEHATEGVTEQLMDLPKVGDYVETYLESRSDESDEERKREQIKIANDRADTGERRLGSLPGCSAEQISASEMAILIKEYWEGREVKLDPNAIPSGAGSIPAKERISPEEAAAEVSHMQEEGV